MGLNYKTEQEMFWASEFGDNYVDRNKNERYIAHRTALFSKIFARTRGIKNIIEFGANIGQNLLAIRNLLPDCSFTALEINENAVRHLQSIEHTQILAGSILDFDCSGLGKHDLSLSSPLAKVFTRFDSVETIHL